MELIARTHRGRVRNRNEDCVAVDETIGVALLADGMGGLPDGHVASREAVAGALTYLQQTFTADDAADADAAVAAAVAAANQRLRTRAAAGAGLMGTTLVVMRLGADGRCRLAHVGDSRAYVLRGGRLELVTRDHSLVQELVDLGVLRPDQARHAPNRNIITRAVGLEADLEADCTALELGAGDLLLLCSDGLWDMLDDQRIAELLTDCKPGRRSLEACADRLVAAANEAGGLDNVSVVLVRR